MAKNKNFYFRITCIVLLFAYMVIFTIISDTFPQETKAVDCYDEHNNRINGLVCYETVSISPYRAFEFIFIFSLFPVMILILSLVALIAIGA